MQPQIPPSPLRGFRTQQMMIILPRGVTPNPESPSQMHATLPLDTHIHNNTWQGMPNLTSCLQGRMQCVRSATPAFWPIGSNPNLLWGRSVCPMPYPPGLNAQAHASWEDGGLTKTGWFESQGSCWVPVDWS
uniref:Uncharacterized protein n=1 Tax=Eutreptiella gymnastica TaxID=73025 RepID=A0A7S1HVD6_9EUGL|mmetsp:Transcript_108364/g.187181  ORF Transcript_108364/g.187181 Transcript_108364/m.187181 type:complete len:132 (+) Transcript_108364:273-668(+)